MEKPSAEQIRIWVEKITDSDREAFNNLFRSLYPRLVRYAFKYMHNKGQASDIVQDAFVILWEKRQELDPQRSIKAYLYRIVRNRSLNYIRDHSDVTVGLEHLDDTRLRSNDKPDRQEKAGELVTLLKEWIEDLPKRQREAFELSRFEGLDHEEVAGVMDVSPNTVNNHIVAALDYLRNRYDVYQKEVNKIGYD